LIAVNGQTAANDTTATVAIHSIAANGPMAARSNRLQLNHFYLPHISKLAQQQQVMKQQQTTSSTVTIAQYQKLVQQQQVKQAQLLLFAHQKQMTQQP